MPVTAPTEERMMWKTEKRLPSCSVIASVLAKLSARLKRTTSLPLK